MTMAGDLPMILRFSAILLACGCTNLSVRAACCSETESNDTCGLCDLSPSLAPQKSWILDLNASFFINNIMLDVSTDNNDSIVVDIGDSSCEAFQDKACYITCSSSDVLQQTACKVTINVTCDVGKNNVNGRYVRVRLNAFNEFDLCDVKVMGWPESCLHNTELKNYALNAPCSQSSTHGHNWQDSKAVDGDRNGTLAGGSCTHTDLAADSNTQVIHWWQVDLGKVILVSHIIIANRIDTCCDKRLANFTTELGNLEPNGSITYTLCRYYNGIAGPLTTLTCTQSLWGQFVRISKTGLTLTLCEVEVYGLEDPNDIVNDSATSEIKCSLKCDDPSLSKEGTSSLEMSNILTVAEQSKIFTQVVGETTMSSAMTKTVVETTVSTPSLTELTGEISVSAALSTVMTTVSGSKMFLKTTPYSGVSTPHSKVSRVLPTETTEPRLPASSSEVTSESGESTEYSLGATMLTPSTTKKHGLCACRCIEAASQTTREDVQQEVTQTAKELVVQRTTLAKEIRKKSSASDQRLSSATVGIICTIAMSSIFLLIVVCDVCRLLQYFVKTKIKTAG